MAQRTRWSCRWSAAPENQSINVVIDQKDGKFRRDERTYIGSIVMVASRLIRLGNRVHAHGPGEASSGILGISHPKLNVVELVALRKRRRDRERKEVR
jgi:hypothetical protein